MLRRTVLKSIIATFCTPVEAITELATKKPVSDPRIYWATKSIKYTDEIRGFRCNIPIIDEFAHIAPEQMDIFINGFKT